MGAKLEFVLNSAGKEFEMADAAKMIRAVGPEHCVLATDYGQPANPFPAEGFATFISTLAKFGFTQAELDTMSKTNPARLLGLP
jgi:hypothetical protein